MKNITSEKLSKRLLQYGALSAAVLGVADASGQIVYTDLDPDQVLNVGDDYLLDMNGDALTNFTPTNPDGLAGGNAAIVFPSSGGAFVGITTGGFQYPALLAENDVIDAGAGYTATGVRGDLNYYGCAYSNSQWCNNVVDGYLGVRFMVGGNTHYGWVRMDTDVNGSNLMVIKDYAYESTPGAAIAAGDMGGLGFEDQSLNDFAYFVDNDELRLSSGIPMNNVVLHSITGQQVQTQALSTTNESVNIAALSSGIYLATVTIDGASKTVKFVKR